jgi:hypothetical protein
LLEQWRHFLWRRRCSAMAGALGAAQMAQSETQYVPEIFTCVEKARFTK